MQPTIIKNFISPETCIFLNNYFRRKATLNPNNLLTVSLTGKQGGFSYLHQDGIEGSTCSDMVKVITDSIAHQFDLPKSKISLNRVNYQVLVEGNEIGYHPDNRGAYEGQMKNVGRSALLYLNNSYVGGEIVFYDKDENGKESGIEYKPDPGTLIYFTGDENHPHSVNKILGGERANLVLFYDVDES